MKKALISTLFGVSLVFAKPYTIDKANSSVWFEVKHFKFNETRGVFDSFDGKIDADPNTKALNVLKAKLILRALTLGTKKRRPPKNSRVF